MIKPLNLVSESNVETPLSLEEEKQKLLDEALAKIVSPSLKSKVLSLQEITNKIEAINLKDQTKEAIEIEKRKEKGIMDFISKLTRLVNTDDMEFVNKEIEEEKLEKYSINTKEIFEKISENDPKKKEDLIETTVMSTDININFSYKIKNFWKSSIKNAQFFEINSLDDKILEYLDNIVYKPVENEFPSFTLEFHFLKNTYFDHDIISKTYYYKDEDRKKFDKAITTEIEWKEEDKNPTQRILTKKVKNKKKGGKKTVTTIKKRKSFFNIFIKDKNTAEKDSAEADFWYTDFFPNCLEYYLGIMEINFEEESGEDEGEDNDE